MKAAKNTGSSKSTRGFYSGRGTSKEALAEHFKVLDEFTLFAHVSLCHYSGFSKWSRYPPVGENPSAWLEIRMLQSFLGFNLSFLDSDL